MSNPVTKVFSSLFRGQLGLKAMVHVSGTQTFCKNGAPKWVKEVFDSNPEINQITASGEEGGAIYQRFPDATDSQDKE